MADRCWRLLQVKTVPYDPRFPATNQARNCYTRYNEYYKWVLQLQFPQDTPGTVTLACGVMRLRMSSPPA